MTTHLVKTNPGGGAWTDEAKEDQYKKGFDVLKNVMLYGPPLSGAALVGHYAGHYIRHNTKWGKALRRRKHLRDLQRNSPLP